MNPLFLALIDDLQKRGFSCSSDDEGTFLNIARADGVHCEFYPAAESDDAVVFCATYHVDGRERELDFDIMLVDGELSGQHMAFVNTVRKILA